MTTSIWLLSTWAQQTVRQRQYQTTDEDGGKRTSYNHFR